MRRKDKKYFSQRKMPTGHVGRPFCTLQHLYAALAATVESLVTGVQYTVLIRFPIIAQYSKDAHYFHRVVGLVVLSMSVATSTGGKKRIQQYNINPKIAMRVVTPAINVVTACLKFFTSLYCQNTCVTNNAKNV